MSNVAGPSTGIDLGNVNPATIAPTTIQTPSTPAANAPTTTTTSTSSSQNDARTGAVSNPTNSPTPVPAPGKSGTNAGVIAGAAVGAAIGAAILTFIITFMLLRKKNQEHRRDKRHRSGSGGHSTYTEKALPKDPSHGGGTVVSAPIWQKHLPQSADDTTTRSSVKTLFDQVELHVENFYRDSAVSMTENVQAELLRVDSPHLPESIVALMPRARSQTALIKHCLLSYIVASISTDDNSVQSLLPQDYATLPHLARASAQKKPGQYRVLACGHFRSLTFI